MDFINALLMIILCHLTIIEIEIDRVRHDARQDTAYKRPVFPIVMICLYLALAVFYTIRLCN